MKENKFIIDKDPFKKQRKWFVEIQPLDMRKSSSVKFFKNRVQALKYAREQGY